MYCRSTLIATILLLGVSVNAQVDSTSVLAPLSYDPYYVLPGGSGHASVDLGVQTPDLNGLIDGSNVLAMAKFSASDPIEIGAHFTFGFINENAANFSSLVIGGKYKLGNSGAAPANLVLPAGDIKDPGLSLGIMQSLSINDSFRINAQMQIAALKGYTAKDGGKGLVAEMLFEPTKSISKNLTIYAPLYIRSNSQDLGDLLAINLHPNIDFSLGDGMVLNTGVSLGLAGKAQAQQLGLFLFILRDM